MRASYAYLLFADVEPAREEDFERSMAEDLVPWLLEDREITSAARFVALNTTPRHLALFELASAGGFQRAREARCAPRAKCEHVLLEAIFPPDAPMQGAAWAGGTARVDGLFIVRVDVDPAHEADYNDFHNEEHLADLCRMPNTICGRRFRAPEGGPRYAHLVYVDDAGVLVRPDRPRLPVTPWRERIRRTLKSHWNGAYRVKPGRTASA
jgi:hypothetical protein